MRKRLEKTQEKIAAGHDAARLAAQKVGISGNQQITQLGRIANQHDTNPLTKRYSISNEAVQFVNSMKSDSQNPADDQGLIYAFAKTMDPDSVVREGEYNTVQKYSQNWSQRFGVNLDRIFNNTGILTPDAREKMKSTILSKAQSTQRMYKDYRKSLVNRMNTVAPGQGENFLGEYLGEGTTPVDEQNIPKSYTDPSGNVYVYDSVRKGYQRTGKAR